MTTIKEVAVTAAAAAEVVEDVVNVSMSYFTGVAEATEIKPTKVRHIINFNDDVNKSPYASELKQAYYLKQYFEHNYDQNGKDLPLKRFFGRITVTITPTSVTIKEKRQFYKRNIVKTFDFTKKADVEKLDSYFAVDIGGVPSLVDDNIKTLTGVKIAGGSVYKAVTNGDVYINKYYDKDDERIKSTFLSKAFKCVTVAMSVTAFALAL